MICIECGEYHVTSNENASFNHICNGGLDTVKMKQGIEILTKTLNEKCGPTTAAARPPPPPPPMPLAPLISVTETKTMTKKTTKKQADLCNELREYFQYVSFFSSNFILFCDTNLFYYFIAGNKIHHLHAKKAIRRK